MTAPLLRIEHLEVRYGDLICVSDASLEVPQGSVVALLRSNGGGKTTTLNAIAGLIPVHSGSIAFGGEVIAGSQSLLHRPIVETMYETFGQLHKEGPTILLAEQSIKLALEVSDFATVLQVG